MSLTFEMAAVRDVVELCGGLGNTHVIKCNTGDRMNAFNIVTLCMVSIERDRECKICGRAKFDAIAMMNVADCVPPEFDRKGMCSNSGYLAFEGRAIEWMKENGWKCKEWIFKTVEGDSFGPLMRICRNVTTPAGIVVDIYNG
jgi:hypothetical protein